MNWADYGLKGLAILGAITLAYWVGKKGVVPVWNAIKGAGTAAKVDWTALETRLTALEVAVGIKQPAPPATPPPNPVPQPIAVAPAAPVIPKAVS